MTGDEKKRSMLDFGDDLEAPAKFLKAIERPKVETFYGTYSVFMLIRIGILERTDLSGW